MSRMQFSLSATDGAARRGQITFPRGTIQTPAFMPVGTYGTVKGMLPKDLADTGAEICLGNTFHLMLRPGTEVIEAHGSLHGFMQWDKPILTDSGGFQVFSLGEMRKISEQGVVFKNPINGDRVELTPEKAMQVQRSLGSDICMIFDECTPFPATEQQARDSMQLSLRWPSVQKRPMRVMMRPVSASSRVACTTTSARNPWPGWWISVLTVMPLAASVWASPRKRCCARWVQSHHICLRTSPVT